MSSILAAQQYRAKAIEYSNLLKIANGVDAAREYTRLQRSFTELADNAQWMIDNDGKTAHSTMRETASVTFAWVDSAASINSQQ